MEKYKWTNTEYPKEEDENGDVLLWVYDSEMEVGYPWIELANYYSGIWIDFAGTPIETDALKVKCWMFLDKGQESEYPETYK